MAIVSSPYRLSRLSAPHAVPGSDHKDPSGSAVSDDDIGDAARCSAAAKVSWLASSMICPPWIGRNMPQGTFGPAARRK